MNGKASSSAHRPHGFGPFQVRTDLGASRFGAVYLGRDPSTNTRVVIRTFELSRERREFGAQSDLLDSFRKLCETMRDHPSVARPLACGAEGEIPYLVYSDLAGTAMDAVMRQDGPRPVAEVLQRARQLADAIDCAASAGIHHGMMAPCDVILDGERSGVTGFGLAQALIKAGIPAEAAAPYGSPQRLAGAPPTHADDIYSLAAVTLELLIGTPRDPEQDTSRALREAQGLPERRRIPRPAPHETRAFTTIAGVDAGKLRASFAAAFSEKPGDRPSTAAEFVASLEDAISNRRVTDEPAPSVAAVPVVSDQREDPPSAPVSDAPRVEGLEAVEGVEGAEGVEAVEGAEGTATLEPPVRQERVVAEGPLDSARGGRAARRRRARARRREKQAPRQPLIQESHEPEPQERTPESRVARPEPIDDVALLREVAALRERSMGEASPGIPPVHSGSRSLLVAGVVAASVASFAAGFGGGVVVGQRSRPSTDSMDISRHDSVAAPQPSRVAVETQQPIASTPQTVAPIPEERASSSESIAPTVAPERAVPSVESGRLVVRSTPAGAGVVVDGQSRGVTPLAVRELAFGAHTIEVSHPGHDTRQQRVTLSTRRPSRSVDVALRPAGVPAEAGAATNSTGSLQVASRPSGAQVFIDDSLIGTTPLLLSNVAAGSRSVRIELSGYQMWTTAIQIKPSARLRVSASLQP